MKKKHVGCDKITFYFVTLKRVNDEDRPKCTAKREVRTEDRSGAVFRRSERFQEERLRKKRQSREREID